MKHSKEIIVKIVFRKRAIVLFAWKITTAVKKWPLSVCYFTKPQKLIIPSRDCTEVQKCFICRLPTRIIAEFSRTAVILMTDNLNRRTEKKHTKKKKLKHACCYFRLLLWQRVKMALAIHAVILTKYFIFMCYALAKLYLQTCPR